MRNKNFLIALIESYADDKLEKVDDKRIMEGVKPAFGSPGGKFFVAGKLIKLFPEHKKYVEAFIGGGSILFRKNKQEGVPEFINDRDEEIAFCFKFMQNLTDEQLKSLESKEWTTKETQFVKLLAAHKDDPKQGDPSERFYRIAYLKAASDAGEMRSYDGRAEGDVMKVPSRLMKLKERLAGVTIENMDYRDFVKKHSDSEAFTFLDPPYPSAKMNWKFCPTQEEFESFTKTVPGKWMVTYEVCDGWKESKFQRRILSQYNLAAPSSGHMTRKKELVVANYDLKENKESKLLNSVDIDMAADIADFVANIEVDIDKLKMSNNKSISNYILINQWHKPKFLEGKQVDDFVLVTDKDQSIHFSCDVLKEGLEKSDLYFKPSLNEMLAVKESVMFLEPESKLNPSLYPAWVKKLDEGKLSITEISDIEKELEFSGGLLTGKFEVKRESKNNDFWKISKLT